ncbi:MAG: CarD family transcriptional regulator [Treponema sp.]|jgi:CarD family transcriptional regulator|nr:CarD family transcriptional regulator [Treponema sp.]
MSIPETKFALNQQVVYPSQGVGKITEIFEKKFKDKEILYYKIYLPVSDMVVMVPVDKAEEIGIRCIVSADEAQEALNMLGDSFEPITSDWKLRYQMNLDLLKKGSIKDIATIVRCLYNRSKVKELPILERKLYDSAKKLLEDEISLAAHIAEKDVESAIHSKLEPPGKAHEPKHSIEIVEDEDDDDEDFMNEDEEEEETPSSENDSDEEMEDTEIDAGADSDDDL